MIAFQGRKRISSQLNMTPMIDVVFLLLIFFMLTSSIVVEQGIDVSLPSSSSSVQSERTQMVVTLKDSALLLDGKTIDLGALKAELSKQLADPEKKPSVTIRSDAGVDVQRLISAMDVVKEAGVTDMAIATVPQ